VRRRTRIALAVAAALLFIPFVVPERARVPVAGASRSDWNKASFWYEPWGASGVHKGIDIFAPSGRSVVAPVPGLVIYRGRLGIGGNVVAVLGPKWRIHYFAHLEESSAHLLHFVRRGEAVGKVGTSGNAAQGAASALRRPAIDPARLEGKRRYAGMETNVLRGSERVARCRVVNRIELGH
jgi:murein DD-endopeptidase MepM/ murein hydrolase activator NlpD